jgi:hypothetical protein
MAKAMPCEQLQEGLMLRVAVLLPYYKHRARRITATWKQDTRQSQQLQVVA